MRETFVTKHEDENRSPRISEISAKKCVIKAEMFSEKVSSSIYFKDEATSSLDAG